MHPEPNDLLRMARDAAGLTQAQLAEQANQQVAPGTDKTGAMDADYIGKLERGVHRWPNRSTAGHCAPCCTSHPMRLSASSVRVTVRLPW